MKKSVFAFTVISIFAVGISFASPKFNLKKAKGIVAYYSFETEIQNKIVKDESSLSNDGRTNSEQTVLVDGKTPGILALHEEQTGYQVYSFLPKLDEWVHIAAVYGNGKMALNFKRIKFL